MPFSFSDNDNKFHVHLWPRNPTRRERKRKSEIEISGHFWQLWVVGKAGIDRIAFGPRQHLNATSSPIIDYCTFLKTVFFNSICVKKELTRVHIESPKTNGFVEYFLRFDKVLRSGQVGFREFSIRQANSATVHVFAENRVFPVVPAEIHFFLFINSFQEIINCLNLYKKDLYFVFMNVGIIGIIFGVKKKYNFFGDV